MTLADQIREFARAQDVDPVRRTHPQLTTHVRIVSGDIVKRMKLHQRTPAVCGALDAKKFQVENAIRLLQRTGPKQGTTATWTFLV